MESTGTLGMLKLWIRAHRVELAILATVFLAHAYFYNGQSWNQNSRLDGMFAFVEPGTNDTHTFHIDRFIIVPDRGINTGDWAKVDGHYYPNKAPGTQFLGIPAYWVLHRIESLAGFSTDGFYISHFNAYLINLWVSVLVSALAAAFFVGHLCRAFQAQPRTAVCITLSCFFSTLIFPFDTQLWGHPTAAAFVLLALVSKGSGRHYAVGALLGAAVVTDYVAIVPLFAVISLYLLHAPSRPLLSRVIMGGLIPAAALLIYHKLLFGSVMTTAVPYSNPIFLGDGLKGGTFGRLDLEVLSRLLFSRERGLFIFMPSLVFAFPGGWLLYKRGHRELVAACGIGIIGILLLISSLNGWHGGSATGPRYLIPSFPFWFILLGGLAYAEKRMKWAFYLVSTFGAFQMLVITSTNTMLSQFTAHPLARVYSSFFSGNLFDRGFPVKYFPRMTEEQQQWTQFDWGRLMGLEGLPSLIPFFVLIGICSYMLRRSSAATGPSE